METRYAIMSNTRTIPLSPARYGCAGIANAAAFFATGFQDFKISPQSLSQGAPGRGGEGGATIMGGIGASATPMNGYPKMFNIRV